MKFLSRRDFLRTSGGLAGAVAGAGLLQASPQAGSSPNDRLNIAVIGVNGQGMSHVRAHAGRNNCHVTAICDVDSNAARRGITTAAKAQGVEPRFVQDIRRLLEDNSIHAVVIATPNHWHALAAIWAMQAGKDVYVEKPVSHNVWEGRQIVQTARRLNRICQTGTQIRSAPGCREAIEFLRSGGLGKVQVARALCYKRRDNAQGMVASRKRMEVPANLDFNLWLGPAAERPYHENLVHYRWHWYWDFGNGDLGNQGIHQMDVARWGLGKNELARTAISVGGRFGPRDEAETPNTQICVLDYGDSQLIFEVRGLETKPYRGAGVGNVFHCTEGYMVFPSYTTAIAYRPDGEVLRRFGERADPLNLHADNFIRAVRSRRREEQHADILEGHLSSALCHLGNISYRLGRQERFNGRNGTFGDNREAAETLARMREHLSDNRVPMDSTMYQVGRRLSIDNKTERFVNDDEACTMLTRQYRRGFEITPIRAVSNP